MTSLPHLPLPAFEDADSGSKGGPDPGLPDPGGLAKDTSAGPKEEAGGQSGEQRSRLRAYRDDGPLCTALGRLAQGQLPPLPGAVVAAFVTGVLAVSGFAGEPSLTLFAPVAALLLTGPAASHPHDGRLDWLVPPVIRATEYGYLAVVGFAGGVPAPLVYLLIAVLAYHHYDTVYRVRQRLWPPEWISMAGLGWDGRLFLVAAAGLLGILPFVYATLTVYLGVVFGVESVRTWLRTERGAGVPVDLEE